MITPGGFIITGLGLVALGAAGFWLIIRLCAAMIAGVHVYFGVGGEWRAEVRAHADGADDDAEGELLLHSGFVQGTISKPIAGVLPETIKADSGKSASFAGGAA